MLQRSISFFIEGYVNKTTVRKCVTDTFSARYPSASNKIKLTI